MSEKTKLASNISKFGYSLTKQANGHVEGDAPHTTVFTFTTKEEAEAFKAANAAFFQWVDVEASYVSQPPAFGTPGVIYEIHTRAGGGCGTIPAGLNEYPHAAV